MGASVSLDDAGTQGPGRECGVPRGSGPWRCLLLGVTVSLNHWLMCGRRLRCDSCCLADASPSSGAVRGGSARFQFGRRQPPGPAGGCSPGRCCWAWDIGHPAGLGLGGTGSPGAAGIPLSHLSGSLTPWAAHTSHGSPSVPLGLRVGCPRPVLAPGQRPAGGCLPRNSGGSLAQEGPPALTPEATPTSPWR